MGILGIKNNVLELIDFKFKTHKVIEPIEIEVTKMNLSDACLTEDLARLLYQNGAKISEKERLSYLSYWNR